MSPSDLDNIVPSIVYFVNRKSTPSWKVEKSLIGFNDLTFVYDGRATYIINDKTYHLKRGDFIYVPSGSLREAYNCADNPVQLYAINFSWYFPRNKNISLPLPSTFRTGIFSELIDLYNNLDRVWIEKEPGYMIKSRAIFMLIIHKLLCIMHFNKLPVTMDQRIKKVKEYILSNYNENIIVDDLANMTGLNPVYLGALFKKNTGYPIKEYINRVRINIAENLLHTGGYSVSDVAERCGFSDTFYFSKVFKKHKGYPPSNALKSKKQ